VNESSLNDYQNLQQKCQGKQNNDRCPICTLKLPCKHSKSEDKQLQMNSITDINTSSNIKNPSKKVSFVDKINEILDEFKLNKIPNNTSIISEKFDEKKNNAQSTLQFKVRARSKSSGYKHLYNLKTFYEKKNDSPKILKMTKRLSILESIKKYKEEKLEMERMKKIEEEKLKELQAIKERKKDRKMKKYFEKQKKKILKYRENKIKELREFMQRENERKSKEIKDRNDKMKMFMESKEKIRQYRENIKQMEQEIKPSVIEKQESNIEFVKSIYKKKLKSKSKIHRM